MLGGFFGHHTASGAKSPAADPVCRDQELQAGLAWGSSSPNTHLRSGAASGNGVATNPAAPVKPSARVQQSYLRCFPSSELQRLPPIFCIGLFCLALLQTTQTFRYSPCPAHSVPSWPRGTAQQTPQGVQERRGIQRGDFADLFLNLRQIYTELLAAPRCSSSHFPNHAELNLPFLLLRREQF